MQIKPSVPQLISANMPETITTTPRVVPGAPPPPPVSKSAKKKRKAGAKSKEPQSETESHVVVPDTTTAALIEKAPEEKDVKEGAVAPQLVAQTSQEPDSPVEIKPSPIVEMLNKRLKANNKKINYQSLPPEKLNEDQKRLLKTLPQLEAVSEALDEVKKAIEVHEAELAHELALQRAEAARAEAERIREAVAAAQAEYLDKAAELVTFLRLQTALANRYPAAVDLNLTEAESIAISSIADHLLHEDISAKTDVIRSIFTGEGEHVGVPCEWYPVLRQIILLNTMIVSRIVEIKEQFLHPPPKEVQEAEEPTETIFVAEQVEAPIAGLPSTLSSTGAINFILTDELAEAEADQSTESAEWVDVQAQPEPEQPAEVEITETITEAQVNGHTIVEDTVTITTTTEVPPSSSLSWADEEHSELPSLANLQAHYGTSAETSPAPETPRGNGSVPLTPSTPQAQGQGDVVVGVAATGAVSGAASVVASAENTAENIAATIAGVIGVASVEVSVGATVADPMENGADVVVVGAEAEVMTSPQSSPPVVQSKEQLHETSQSVKMAEAEKKKAVVNTWLSPQLSSYFIAGGIAGAASRTVVSPLERLKIIQQVQPTTSDKQYKGVWSSLVRMWREEGFKGFMRGNGINCLRIIPYSGSPDTVHDHLTLLLGYVPARSPVSLRSTSVSAASSSAPAQPALASAYHTASTSTRPVAAAVFSPKDLTMWGMTLKVMREEGGVRALYRGLVPTAMGVAPYVGINFASYEALRGVITPPGKSSVHRKLLCGALAGSISQTLTYPFDVLRRKMQVTGMNGLGIKYNGAMDALQSIRALAQFTLVFSGAETDACHPGGMCGTVQKDGNIRSEDDEAKMPRTTDTHALSSSVPSSLSSTSLSSSFSSSRASSDLLPAAPLSNSSQSDIITSDRSVSSLSSSSKSRFFPLVLTSAPPRSASLASMGQTHARFAAPPSPPPLSPAPSTSSSSTGGRLKRAWAGRRKKSEDITAMFTNTQRSEKGRVREHAAAAAPPPSAMPDLSEPRLERPPSRGAGGPKLLSLQNVFGGKKAAQQPKPGKSSSPVPPLPPPKLAAASGSQRPPLSPSLPATPHKDAQVAPAAPAPIPPSPSRLPAQEPKSSSEGREHTASGTSESANAQEKEKAKEDWRKSDSTMASHSTIRPGALSGNRSPRPVSLAESSHSATTIVPPVNKRLSALITDAEFTMFEEADGDAADDSSRVLSESPLASSRDTPTLTRAAAAGIIAPVNAGGSAQAAGNNIRGRLAAWTTTPTSPPTREERPLPAPPPPQPRRQPGSPPPPSINPTFRQTAVSMTGSLAPAAGFAMGFGKRAVEKVGRAWGGLSSSASHHSGYSSSSTAAASSSSVKVSESASGYASAPQSGPTSGWKRRKAPHGFSGGSSISSFASTSSEDHYAPSGPQLGRRLRGPRVSGSGRPAGGLVFRRDLRTCVQETAIEDVKIRLANGQHNEDESSAFKPLEARLLPALVVRCAQHILRWGIQEEGLFRVSGRSSHVAKLRAEFDAGSDYDLIACEPGDLDPHAVASIFKTFLRELPEPLLTSALMPYFEAAVKGDQDEGGETGDSSRTITMGASNLTLRKPPSLSTLAMPNFAGLRSLSEEQVTAVAFLISRLPVENRDLLYTVVELIKATAARSVDTKMPLGNLLLVFCPSLNMSATLLRVLCEANPIWDGPPETMPETAPLANVEMSPRQEEPGNAKAAAPTVDLRLPVIELDDVADSPQDESPGDDGASFVSALEPSSRNPTRSPSPAVYGAAIPPLSSSDSLDSSSFSDELASPDPPSCRPTGENKSALASANSLAIPETTDLSLNATPRLVTDVPVPFPSTGGSVPPTPSTHAPLSHRKSYTLLSFPHLRSESSPDVLGNAPCGAKRTKRPSLHLLFSKKSSSSLPSASDSATSSAHGLHGSSGNLVISAPRPIIASSPPRLDTDISSSPIRLAFEEAASQLKGTDTARSAPALVASSTLTAPALDMRSDSGGSSIFSTPQSTPIADFFRGRTTSIFCSDTSSDTSPSGRARSASQASETPSISVNVADTQQEDWMQSVLLAAHARGTSAAS
ncbi:hypothetical protein ACG7TL_004611 [Trametes sanguinea]